MGAQQGCCCADKDDDDSLVMARSMAPGATPDEGYLAGVAGAVTAEAEPAAFSAGAEAEKEQEASAASEKKDEAKDKAPEVSKKAEPAAEPRVSKAMHSNPSSMPSGGTNSPYEVAVYLERTAEVTIGLNIDALEDTAPFVDGILPGAIQMWNDAHPNDSKVQVYDRIIAINGRSGSTNVMLAEMRQSLKWNLVVQRPLEIHLSVDCERSPSLGLDLKYSPNGGSLLISSISDGAVKEWNKNAQKNIRPADRIIEVNSKRGTAKQLLESATNVDTLDLYILHFE